MRRLIAPLFLSCLLLCVASVAAQTTAPQATAPDDALLQHVLAELGQHQAVRADFVQTRANPALTQPQVSRGQLLFVLNRGMLWQTQSPYAETLALTGKHAARIDAQGHAHPMRDARGVDRISQMLQSMLAGKLDEVLRQFNVVASGTTANWTLRFTPKQERMARVLGSITLSGDAFLEGIRIAMHDGGSTDIRFAHTRDAGPLSALERRALGLP